MLIEGTLSHTRPIPKPTRILTVDVEDYFHVEAFTDVVRRSDWDLYECRVELSTHRLLDLFDEWGVRATFFILGWVAERYPGLVREIVARGHEPACHSYWHRLIYKLSWREFRDDTRQAKAAIEDAAGMAVRGYRAPSYSIVKKSLWALSILVEEGFHYDSSIFPIRHDIYGMAEASRVPYQIETESGPLLEFPLTTFRMQTSRNLPVGGGGYLRIFPFWYTKMGVERAEADGVPLIAYVHPWEIDAEQPRVPGRAKSRLRHYTNLANMEEKLGKLVQLGHFTNFQQSGMLHPEFARVGGPRRTAAGVI